MVTVFVYIGFIIFAITFLRILYSFIGNNAGVPRNWPFVGMIPALSLNIHQPHEFVVQILKRSNGTFFFKGLWFTNTSFLVTSDPENVHHILSSNISVYLKGSEWKKVFDIFGESIFNCDGETWKRHRKVFHDFFSHQQFKQSLPKILRQRIEEGLVKVLEYVCRQEMVVDLQDLFARHTFDISCAWTVGFSRGVLSTEFPENGFHKATEDAMEAAFYRYLMPDSLWKLQSWLQIGKEKKRSDARKAYDDHLTHFISIQREKSKKISVESSSSSSTDQDQDSDFNLLKCYLTGHEITGRTPKESLIRDNIIVFFLASDDTYSLTLTWFFYLISKTPMVENKIREEIKRHLSMKEVDHGLHIPSRFEELSKLTYLHAAFCETLRLYPPVPFEFRTCTKPDFLPSGHRVDPSTRVMIGIHAMGRMESLWGEDCCEFKPERWITKEGKIKRELPSKFCAFLAGPRSCLGKEISFYLMKATATTIIHNYNVEVIEGQKIGPINSVLYQMKKGLMVRVKKRYS